MKIRAHETFSIRKGWIHKGVKNIRVYPRLFTDKNINPCDILGIGTNMVKSLRYWMTAVGIMEEYEKHSFRIKKDSEYQEYLQEELNDYFNWIAENYNEYTDEVKKITDSIKDAVSLYYKSDFLSAIQSIKTIVDGENLLSCDEKMKDKNYTNALFKARVAESTENIKHKDMLHIPFDRRSIVSSQRFSLSGTPCIYMAKSSYTCWLELNKPEENKFFVSAFELKGVKRFLDLTCLTWEELEDGIKDKNEIKAKLCTFPLIIATSFIVDENSGKPFHSEYIISELLMNVIAISDKYDGVAYFSKKFSDKKRYYPINVCFALLAKFNNEKYTSDIDDFAWTNPMSLREYSLINWDARFDELITDGNFDEREKKIKNPPFTLIGENVAYSDTLMHDFDEWIIEKMKSTKGENEELK